MGLGGCAQVGTVEAPSAGLPQPVGDFQAQRLGPSVHLRFTAPTRTSDGAAYRAGKYGALRYALCVWPGVERGQTPAARAPEIPNAGTPVPRQVPDRAAALPGGGGRYPLPNGAVMPPCPELIAVRGEAVALNTVTAPRGVVTMALAAESGDGAWAGWSNAVQLSLAEVTAAPDLTRIALRPEGVELDWTLPEPPPSAILVFRQQNDSPGVAIARLAGERTSYLDTSAVLHQDYTYWLRSATGEGVEEAESADSAHKRIRTRDVFPPPVPTGVQVVAAPGGQGVDLSWNPVSAPDLAGYNVYRRTDNGAWQKRNATVVATPVFHDSIETGGAAPEGAAYAVTAVDMAGNESARSRTVRVP